MKTPRDKRSSRHLPYPYRRNQLKSNCPEKQTQPTSFGYHQACALLQAIEINNRKRLNKRCLAHLSIFVLQAWEGKPCVERIQQLYYMMNNLLDTTCMDPNEPFDTTLQKFCQSPVSTPTICPSVTLLIAISYVERLNKRYRDLKGTAGCASRMIMVAFIMATKYIHDSLRLIIYTNSRKPFSVDRPITPPASPKIYLATTPVVNATRHMSTTTITTHTGNVKASSLNSDSKPPLNLNTDDTIVHEKDEFLAQQTEPSKGEDRNLRIARMEQEFLFFLNYDLSVQDPSLLVRWAQSYEDPEKRNDIKEEYTSADEGDDEMDDEEEKNNK